MRNKMRNLILGLLVFAMMLTVTACGGKTEQPGTDTKVETPQRAATNEVNVGIPQDLEDSLDPHLTTAAGTREVLFNIFEGLVKPDSEGNIIPAVAEKCDVSPDGTVYTFTLRDGVKFHNGEDVTVDDVVYSISRAAGMLDDGAYIAKESLAGIVSVEATDDKTVVITLSDCNTEFLATLATSNVAIIPKDYEDQATAPIGTGPFKFVSRSPQENFVMEKFDEYWGEPAKLDKVTYLITAADSLVMSLKSGAIDICAHLTVDQAKSVEDQYNIEKDTMKLVQALYLNNAVEPFNDVRVRQALCYAVNVQEIIDFVCDGYGVRVGSSMCPAFKKYFREDLSDYYTQDVEKAKELLNEAGYPDGFSFTITVPSNYPQHVQAAEVIAQQLQAVGITAELKQVEWGTWVSDTYVGRDFQSTVVGFDASTLSARAWLERWTTGYSKNMINFSDSEYDELFQKAISSTDDNEQTELYKQMEQILTEEAANVYIQDLCDMVAVNKALDGLQFYPAYVLDLSTVYYKK